jgi:hypothetical protein
VTWPGPESRAEPKDIAVRQEQADAIAEWLNDRRSPGGSVDMARGIPMAQLGDWNACRSGVEKYNATLLTGSIVNQQRFGPGGLPDWDELPLRDAHPLPDATGPETHTFGDGSGNGFPPAQLDRVLFSDSVLDMLGGFLLDTTRLSPASLLYTQGLTAPEVPFALLHLERNG